MAKGAKQKVADWLAGRGEVSLADFAELEAVAGVSAVHLRRVLRGMPVRLAPEVEGVRQDSRENLERTLAAQSRLYAGDPVGTRARVLEAKQHARLALRRKPEEEWRQEVLLHLNTWLENPAIYPLWVELTKKKAATRG